MNRRQLIRMTDEEIQAFLQEWHTLQVATIDHDGAPHIIAMWYVLVEGELAFWTYAKSQKVMNLRRDPRLACLVEDGKQYNELRGVLIKGRAEISSDPTVVLGLGERLFERYQGPLDEQARKQVAYEGAKRVAIVVKPTEIVSWDHHKLGGTY